MSRLAEQYLADYGYPDSPGFREKGGTSEEAAAIVASSSTNLRTMALDKIRENPATADEVADALGMSVLAIRPRISELRKLGKIVRNGDRRPNASGILAWVWRAVSDAR